MGRDKKHKQEYDKVYHKTHDDLKLIREKRREWRKLNPEGNKKNQRRWKINHPEQVRDMGRDYCYRTKYGITLSQYNELLKNQNGVCLLCGKKTAYKTKGRNLFVDHDHKTGKIRGLLCSRCNTMIAHLELTGIERVVEYLRKTL